MENITIQQLPAIVMSITLIGVTVILHIGGRKENTNGPRTRKETLKEAAKFVGLLLGVLVMAVLCTSDPLAVTLQLGRRVALYAIVATGSTVLFFVAIVFVRDVIMVLRALVTHQVTLHELLRFDQLTWRDIFPWLQ